MSPMRRLTIGSLLLAAALLFILPHFMNRQSPAKFGYATSTVRLYLHQENKIKKIQLEEYLIGVVAAEMPAEFPLEALKAQAVAARTYAVKRMGTGGVANPLHPGADLCDDHRHGQAWLSREELKERWGTLYYYKYFYKVKTAVDETRGEVLTYQEQLIDPAYHAACGGKTENSEDVWKFQVPYLRSVPCPYEDDPQSVQAVSISLEQVDQALGTTLAAVPASGNKAAGEMKVIERTSSGRPKTLVVDGQQFPAVSVRDLLGLRSTNFTWKLQDGSITFTTTGYGHGVGMCQYGAKGMAEHGYTYRTILGHYYSGVEITGLEN
ncbi:Amidase enhancer precursor [Pelotomaculum schinkii]|uniref:Amidase enhancer n=2 Tax=Pelotomaculum schinkii TaxID=78350 RepID=A0A4Y7R5H4_9FIRM|nr:Amidase enhancer precursor [Pelotomaculum schinkii]